MAVRGVFQLSSTLAGAAALRYRVRRGPGPPALVWVPAVLVVGAGLLPLLYLVLRAVGAGSATLDLVLRARTLEILLRSAGLAFAVTVASAAIAVPLAWLTVRTDLPLRRAWTILAVLPLTIPSYVGGFIFVAALGPKGMLQVLLAGLVGLDRLPEIYGFPGAALVLTLFSYPYLLLSVRAGLQGLDPTLEEASRSLGQRGWSTFWRVTLPQLRPSIASGALLVALYALSDFGVVSLLQFDSFTRAIYKQYQASFDRTMAAVLALLLVALTSAVLVAERRLRGRARYYRRGPGARRLATLTRLGRWRWPSLAFCCLVVALSLVLPLVVLGYWLLRGLAQGSQVDFGWSAALSSAQVSAIAALAAVAAALPVAVLSVRFRGALSSLLEQATYVGFALPGVVVALALVFFGANYATPVYQTLVLLVAAYVVRFLPQALGATRTSLLQVSPSLEEAARGLGRSPTRVLAEVTVPLLRPGLIAGLAMVFLTTMKELPATLLLSPIGFKTLATTIWTSTSEGRFAGGAGPALLLILLSGASMAFLTRDSDSSDASRVAGERNE